MKNKIVVALCVMSVLCVTGCSKYEHKYVKSAEEMLETEEQKDPFDDPEMDAAEENIKRNIDVSTFAERLEKLGFSAVEKGENNVYSPPESVIDVSFGNYDSKAHSIQLSTYELNKNEKEKENELQLFQKALQEAIACIEDVNEKKINKLMDLVKKAKSAGEYKYSNNILVEYEVDENEDIVIFITRLNVGVE